MFWLPTTALTTFPILQGDYMNRKMIFYMLGKIMLVEAGLLSLPILCGLIYREASVVWFLVTAAIAAAFGFLMTLVSKTKDKTFFAKEGFVIVSLAWIFISAVGALPFFLSGQIPNYIDAFFETVSGFTTTGASILPNVEALDKCMLLWRSFTHWVGGMGVIVFVMAILPTESGRTMHIMRAEVPGPVVGKLVPKIKTTAKILYLIYIALTIIEIILLLCGGTKAFDSVVLSLGTAGTGGFAIKADGLASYTPYQQWVIAIFMMIFGINFNIYYLIITKKLVNAIKSEEVWTYIIMILTASGIIAYNTYSIYNNAGDAIRHAFFQVNSIVSTTGYATTDFNLWPSLSKGIIVILMFIGGCAGSTAGGFKLSRVILLCKNAIASVKQMIHSRSVSAIRFEGKAVDNATISGVTNYLAVYVLCFFVILVIILFEPFSFQMNFATVTSCFNNIGPSFEAAGPMGNYDCYSYFAKVVLSFAMLLGRLEIFPMLILFSPTVWKKRRAKS